MTNKSFDKADETRTPPKTRVEVVRLGDVQAARMTLEPGWRWSECIKPVAGTDSCQLKHVGHAEAGAMHVVQDDGTEFDINAGDAYTIAPGHDASVTSNEPFIGYEFETKTVETFATTPD